MECYVHQKTVVKLKGQRILRHDLMYAIEKLNKDL